jgi:hypothetical protein
VVHRTWQSTYTGSYRSYKSVSNYAAVVISRCLHLLTPIAATTSPVLTLLVCPTLSTPQLLPSTQSRPWVPSHSSPGLGLLAWLAGSLIVCISTGSTWPNSGLIRGVLRRTAAAWRTRRWWGRHVILRHVICCAGVEARWWWRLLMGLVLRPAW